MKVSKSARQPLLPLIGRVSRLVYGATGLLICCTISEVGAADPYWGRQHLLSNETDSVVCSLPSGSSVAGPLSLAQAVDLALCNNAQIRISWAKIREQAAAVGEAKAAYWPTLSVALSELKEDTSYPGSKLPAVSQTEHTVYGSLDWRLFDLVDVQRDGGLPRRRLRRRWQAAMGLSRKPLAP
jgi:hypothetical protein